MWDTLHELCITYPGVLISPQVTMPEVLPMESKPQPPKIAQYFLLLPHHLMLAEVPASHWLVFSSPGRLRNGWRTSLHAPKEWDTELGIAVWCAASSRCCHMSLLDHRRSQLHCRQTVIVPGTWSHLRQRRGPQPCNEIPACFCLQGLAAVSS